MKDEWSDRTVPPPFPPPLLAQDGVYRPGITRGVPQFMADDVMGPCAANGVVHVLCDWMAVVDKQLEPLSHMCSTLMAVMGSPSSCWHPCPILAGLRCPHPFNRIGCSAWCTLLAMCSSQVTITKGWPCVTLRFDCTG